MRKKKKRSRHSGSLSKNNHKQVFAINDWEQPGWLKEAASLVSQGKPENAAQILTEESLEKHIRTASRIEKEFIRFSAAGLLYQIGQPQRAEELYKEILKTQPVSAVYNELSRICEKRGHLNRSVRYLSLAMQKDPNSPGIWCNLGNNLIHLGQAQKGIEFVRKAVEKMPKNSRVHSNLLFRLHHLSNIDREELFNEHKKWGQIHAPMSMAKTNHDNIPDPNRKLRIGYISPDFCAHPVGMFFAPLLESHHRAEVEVYGYGDIELPDKVTEELKNKFDHYRNIRGIDDKNAAAMIEQDQIDILVDLAGHTGGSRLRVLAYKPAPIQATYLGYFDTTGMEQVDYFLTDEKMSPVSSQRFHIEKLFFLPGSCLCYKPLSTSPVGSLPACEKGYTTFGMFGNASKINPYIVSLWTSVLKNNENSRMLLMFKGGDDKEITEHYYSLFEKFGIPRNRVDFHGRKMFFDYLKMYGEVDIILDTYPYNGGTTTCDALWMGVPVISLVGQHHFSRVGLSILNSVGLEFFATSTPDEYASKASALAAKPEALAKIRCSTRNRMAASTLCDKNLFARNIEQAYKDMWRHWCQSRGVNI